MLCSIASRAAESSNDEYKWLNITMPIRSHFAGFDPPTDEVKWKQAINHAINGSQVLLQKVQQQIKSYEDVLKGN